MQVNPVEDWQRLTEHYREMSDEDLQEIAADFVDLTETAQQVLRNEMKNRGLADPKAPKNSDHPAVPRCDPPASPTAGEAQSNVSGIEENDVSQEYTWKTTLCECGDMAQASQIGEVLKQAGIESWVEQPGSRYSMFVGSPRVLVAADQLDQAREIVARPIPQEIVDQFSSAPPEFEPPRCPKCGAEDPVLEGVDPSNSWRCEACGKQWTEPTGQLNETQEKTGP